MKSRPSRHNRRCKDKHLCLLTTSNGGGFFQNYRCGGDNHLKWDDTVHYRQRCCHQPDWEKCWLWPRYISQVSGLAISGGRVLSDEHMREWKETLLSSKPDLVFMFLGGNDSEVLFQGLEPVVSLEVSQIPALVRGYRQGGFLPAFTSLLEEGVELLSSLGQERVDSLVGRFVSRLLSFRGVAGGLVRFTVSSMPFRYEDSLELLLLKCYFNRFLKKMLESHSRYEYLEVNGIFDVGGECFRGLLCPNSSTDFVHYNKGTMRRVVSLYHTHC